jgi:lactate dehydrogenase-like 2-hydroxyacid dehydrogenase
MNEKRKFKITIVNSSTFGLVFPEHLERLKKLGTIRWLTVEGDCHGQKLANLIGKTDIIITSGTPQYDADFFKSVSGIKLISRDGLGYNNIDVAAADAAGVYVTKVPRHVEREAVAEYTFALLFDAIRLIEKAASSVKQNRWYDRGMFVGFELKNKTLGIIGCGNIGTRVAEIASHGFGMSVLVYDPVHYDYWAESNNIRYVNIDELVSHADVITVHATLNKNSYHLIGKDFLSKVKDKVIIINTARGAIIDNEAMLKALDSGKVALLGIDALSVEPPAMSDPFINNDKVIVTPHIGAYTKEALKGMGEKCVSDVETIVKGEIPMGIVNANMRED